MYLRSGTGHVLDKDTSLQRACLHKDYHSTTMSQHEADIVVKIVSSGPLADAHGRVAAIVEELVLLRDIQKTLQAQLTNEQAQLWDMTHV